MRAVGFGTEAEKYVARLCPSTALIAAGLDGCVAALAAAVEWRRAGKRFSVATLIDEPRAVIAQRLAGRWIEHFKDIDDRYEAFDALAAERYCDAAIAVDEAELAVFDEPARRVLRDVAIMGDALVVRSQREAERVTRLLKRYRPAIVVAPSEDLTVPRLTPERDRTVVVWAPSLPASSLGVIAMALEYLRCPVVYVCATGKLAGVRGTFVTAASAESALTGAGCVIDASIGDPGGAIALARLGLPIVCTTTSGAGEFLTGAFAYDPWDWRSLFAAVSSAFGAPAARIAPSASRQPDCEIANVPPPVVGTEPPPLVSYSIATYNRRALLPIALDSLARQTYANIEIVVVNNGGEDVCDIVARYPNARLIDLPTNLIPGDAVELGFMACNGKYLGCMSDDDEIFPDHVERLVAALERANAHVGHTNTITRYTAERDGTRETVAYRVLADRPSDRLQLLVGATMSILSMLFRHDVRQLIGGFKANLGPADLEYQMRCAQHFDFVHVDAVTCEFVYAVEGSSFTHQDAMFAGLKRLYVEYPDGGSRIVQRRRRAEIARFDQRNSGRPLWPPDMYLTQPAVANAR